MKCPKCKTEMVIKEVKGIQIDRCPGCGGFFLDKGELKDVDDKDIGSIIDICAYSKKAEHMDEVPAHCYKCDNPMMQLKGAGDVNFDWCDKCEGVFFDRGELASIDLFQNMD
ncbi:MAG: zf-TFIIB domain-containing protein [Deltaproteobacteria bacterium]|nr:zf-TFIIB domain-containing protein [Deltaproteobacteria bacterium]